MKQSPRMSAMVVGIAIIGLLSAILLAPLTFAGAPGRSHLASSAPLHESLEVAVAQASPEGSPAATPEATPMPEGWLAITKVDAEGQPVAGACFSVFLDAGGGVRGRVVVMGDLCDDSHDNRTGNLSREVPAGRLRAGGGITPEGFAPAPDLPFRSIPGRQRAS